MAPIKITGVVSCSSEDKISCARNLLVADSFKKWSTDKPGLTNASVILQLESEQHITGVDIGNNGSAFVEVLVANSANEGDYQNLIITSAFMSPSESRSQNNRVKLRMFGKDELCKPILEKKWDRVKVVCTQPYNKTVTFGLSVVTIHGPNLASNNASLQVVDTPEDVTQSTPKRASNPPAKSVSETTPRRKSSPLPNKDPSESKAAASKLLSKLQSEQGSSTAEAMNRLKESAEKAWPKSSQSVIDIADDNQQSPSHRPKNAQSSSGKTPQPKAKVAFSCLLDGVVFVLSGFQNPLRSDIREIGISMGAQYRPDWTSDSTHLICSVPNTPKFNQVKGKGIIVSKEWLFDCKKKKERLPEKSYRLDRTKSKSPKPSDESDDEKAGVQPQVTVSKRKHKANVSYVEIDSSDEETSKLKKRKVQENSDDDEFVPSQTISSDEDESESVVENSVESLEILQGNSSNGREPDDPMNTSTIPDISDSESETEAASVMDAETDEETENDVIKRLELPPLPDFFAGHRFFLHSDSFNDTSEFRKLNRWLIAYGGKVFDHMNENVKFIITKADCWMPDFHQALSVNSSIKFLHSSWVEECSSQLQALDKNAFYIENSNSEQSVS